MCLSLDPCVTAGEEKVGSCLVELALQLHTHLGSQLIYSLTAVVFHTLLGPGEQWNREGRA